MRPILAAFASAVAFTAAVTRPASAQAQDLSTFTRNGSAVLGADGQIVLTPARDYQIGSAFRATPVATSGLQLLTATFNYTIGGGTGADGLAFVLQGDGPNALGTLGSGVGANVGFAGIGSSLAALLRTHTYNVVQIGTNGQLNGNSAASPTLRRTNDVRVTYAAAGDVFSVFLNGAPIVSQTGVDLAALVGPEAYVGFTSSTGASNDVQQVNSFSIATTYATTATVPEPRSLALVGAGLLSVGVAGWRRRITTG